MVIKRKALKIIRGEVLTVLLFERFRFIFANGHLYTPFGNFKIGKGLK